MATTPEPSDEPAQLMDERTGEPAALVHTNGDVSIRLDGELRRMPCADWIRLLGFVGVVYLKSEQGYFTDILDGHSRHGLAIAGRLFWAAAGEVGRATYRQTARELAAREAGGASTAEKPQ